MWNFIYSFVHPGVFLGLTIRSVLYPDFFLPTGLPPLGNVTLTSDLENCNSLTRIAITIETDAVYTNYFIGFCTSTNLGGIYIWEEFIMVKRNLVMRLFQLDQVCKFYL